MIITISGSPGSGKSTVADMVANKLDLKRYSNGDFMREMAEARGVAWKEFHNIAEADPRVDEELDERQRTLGQEEDDFVIDSRLGWHFIPQSIKIFLHVDPEEGAKRIMKDNRAEESFDSIGKAMEKIKERADSEKKRYKEMYGIDFLKKDNYDLWLDTTSMTVEEVVDKIISFVKQEKEKADA
ncbi:AAA family ATPase [Candidatus Woesearchaeota archaeon]|nr:AAA family ATPase [Candidatus Woesearchaeota archaeon]